MTSEARCILHCPPNAFSSAGQPFATAEFTNEFEGKFLFHKLPFHAYRRDVPADSFREMINAEDYLRVFVAPGRAPGARTLRGLMNVTDDAMLGIDPGLSFPWPHDRVRPLPRGAGLSGSLVLSVHTI